MMSRRVASSRLPHQRLGEIDRRREQHETRETALFAFRREPPGQKQRDPAAHGAADDDLRPLRRTFEDALALLQPVADAALLETPLGRPWPE